MKKMIAAAVAFVTAVLCCAVTLSGCEKKTAEPGENRNIKAAVMSGSSGNNIYNSLEYGVIANVDVRNTSSGSDLSMYDIIYIEKGTENIDAAAIDEYVYNGGTVVLDNSYITMFSNDFLGAAQTVKIDVCPIDMTYPTPGENLAPISELLYDYTSALKEYANAEAYLNMDYGMGIIPSTAEIIAGVGETGVYTMNKYGEGTVFITNPILPSEYTVLSLEEGEKGEPMAINTSGAGNLLISYYAEYVSKEKYGFAVERTFGSFGTRPAAWELHYEDITGIENNSLEAFSKLCMSKGQMPSYTLARSLYTWFKRAESVTYLKAEQDGYKNDVYEGAYCSGTHIASSGRWLEIDCYEQTESYFDDNKEYTKRAYPCPIDWNEDGNLDFICGSADGRFYYYNGYGMGTNYETGIATLLTDSEGNALSVGAYSSPVVFDIDGDGRGELVSGSESGKIFAFESMKTEENPDSLVFEYKGEVLDTGLTDCMIACGFLNDDNIMDLAVGSRDGEIRVYYGYTLDGQTTLFGDYVTVGSNESWAAPCIYNHTLWSGTLEGYVAYYDYNGSEYVLGGYLEYDDVSRRGDRRITIGMNSVPRFADIDNDGDDDLICGVLEYGMAYPMDSEYFPYADELREQLKFCEENNIYMGVHGYTHRYATPEHERLELDYHKAAFEKFNIAWDGKGVNQHTWYTSCYGYDRSGINGYNPDYDGTFVSQYNSGLLWNNGSRLPESKASPERCAENAVPMPMYMPNCDFLIMETSNTPHGNGAFSYTSVKYDMPMLFYNHCDYIYSQSESQEAAVDKVAQVTEDYGYVFVGENQMAKAVSAAYNTDIKAELLADGNIRISGAVRDTSRKLYDEKYSKTVGVKVVFADGENAENYSFDSAVGRRENNAVYAVLTEPVVIKKGADNSETHISMINVPAEIKSKKDGAEIRFKESGLMYARITGEAYTEDSSWSVKADGNDTVFTKFGDSEKLTVKMK